MAMVEVRATLPLRYTNTDAGLDIRDGKYSSGTTIPEAIEKVVAKYLGQPVDVQIWNPPPEGVFSNMDRNDFIGTFIKMHEDSGMVKLPHVPVSLANTKEEVVP